MNRQFSLADLLRQSVYSRLAGYEDLNDAALAADPTFRLIGSPKIWDRGVDAYGADAAWELDAPCDEEIWTCGE